MFFKSILSGTVAAFSCVASPTMLKSIGCLILMAPIASGVVISDTLDLTTGPGTVSGMSITGLSFTNSGVTVNYDLDVAVDWLDSTGASAPLGLFSGSLVHGSFPLGFDTLDGAGVDEEQLVIDGFSFTSGGTTTNYYAKLTFTVSNVSVSTGGSFTGFTSFVSGNGMNAGIVDNLPVTGGGTTALMLNPILTNDITGNTDDSDFRVRELTLNFDVAAVPEPNSAMLLGLLGAVSYTHLTLPTKA